MIRRGVGVVLMLNNIGLSMLETYLGSTLLILEIPMPDFASFRKSFFLLFYYISMLTLTVRATLKQRCNICWEKSFSLLTKTNETKTKHRRNTKF